MEKEENKILVKNDGKFKTIIINLLLIITVIVVGVYLYSKYIGTKKIIVKEYRIASENIPSSFSGKKIVYFSDLLYGSSVYSDDLDYIKDKINVLKPDIVIFGGDLVHKDFKLNEEDRNSLIKFLKDIDAKLGKYSSLGSLDNDDVKNMLEEANFKVLINKDELVYSDSDYIVLSFIGSYNKSEYKINEVMNINGFNIVITHEGDLIDSVLEKKYPDMILSGNSVGGEIRLPYFGGVFSFAGSKKYKEEKYNIGDSKVFVSSGIGTKKIYKRFNNRPSISLFRLKSL